jgi:hypothetical protein
MTADVVLTPAHWIYLIGVLVIIVTLVLRANVVAPAIVATLATAFAMTGQLSTSLEAIFFGPLTAARELFNIFLVISLMTSFMNALRLLQADVRIVRPFRRVMTNGHVGFFVLGLASYLLSLFFWPTPAVPLIAGILLPAAIYAGVPPLGAALCIAIAGLGTALSSDYVIKVGPGISAKAAGIPLTSLADKALVLSLITGGVAFAIAYLRVRSSMLTPNVANLARWENTIVDGAIETPSRRHRSVRWWRPLGRGSSAGSTGDRQLALAFASPAVSPRITVAPPVQDRPPARLCDTPDEERTKSGEALRHLPATAVPPSEDEAKLTAAQVLWSQIFAIITPLAFLAMVAFMTLPKLVPGMRTAGGTAAAGLVGGVAAILMVLATAAFDYRSICSGTAERIKEGFVFSFRAMSSVLPIAGFFFIGVAGTAGPIIGLPEGAHAPGLLADLVKAGAHWIPQSPFFLAFGILVSGMVTGIDGSGFAGLPLTGALASALGHAVGFDVSTLAAIGQMGSVWTGKTLTAWSALAAVASFARIPVLEAVRHLLLPVICGLIASTLFAVIFW